AQAVRAHRGAIRRCRGDDHAGPRMSAARESRPVPRAVIALCSNLGDREQTLRSAVRALAGVDGVRLVAAAALMETPARTLHGVDETATGYLNAVVIAETALAPIAILDALQRIEDKH